MGKTVVSYLDDSRQKVPEDAAAWMCTEQYDDAGNIVKTSLVNLAHQKKQLEVSETEAEERKAMERFLSEALEYSESRIAAMSKSPDGLSWSERRDAWNYHDESWEEYESFSLRRITREEYEKNRFQEKEPGWSWYVYALKRWDPHAEYSIHRSYSIEGCRHKDVEKIYLARIPGCTGPFCLEHVKEDDRE